MKTKSMILAESTAHVLVSWSRFVAWMRASNRLQVSGPHSLLPSRQTRLRVCVQARGDIVKAQHRFRVVEQVALKLQEQLKDKIQKWVLLSPLALTGRLNKLSTWAVLSKPVRQRVLYNALSDLAAGKPLSPALRDGDGSDAEESVSKTGGHILCVEDNPTIQLQMRKILTNAGYLVDIAGATSLRGPEGICRPL